MSEISRRKLITTGLAVAAGASGVGVATALAKRYGLIPPDSGGVYGPGETLTYAAQRLLNSRAMHVNSHRTRFPKIRLLMRLRRSVTNSIACRPQVLWTGG